MPTTRSVGKGSRFPEDSSSSSQSNTENSDNTESTATSGETVTDAYTERNSVDNESSGATAIQISQENTQRVTVERTHEARNNTSPMIQDSLPPLSREPADEDCRPERAASRRKFTSKDEARLQVLYVKLEIAQLEERKRLTEECSDEEHIDARSRVSSWLTQPDGVNHAYRPTTTGRYSPSEQQPPPVLAGLLRDTGYTKPAVPRHVDERPPVDTQGSSHATNSKVTRNNILTLRTQERTKGGGSTGPAAGRGDSGHIEKIHNSEVIVSLSNSKSEKLNVERPQLAAVQYSDGAIRRSSTEGRQLQTTAIHSMPTGRSQPVDGYQPKGNYAPHPDEYIKPPSRYRSSSSVVNEKIEVEEVFKEPLAAPAGATQKSEIGQLTDLFAALREGNSRYVSELPIFNGTQHDWLPYRTAYRETEDKFSKAENVRRIRRSLRGAAKAVVENKLYSTDNPEHIMEILDIQFGTREAIVIEELTKLQNLPRLTDKPEDVRTFCTKVVNSVTTLQDLGQEDNLNNVLLHACLESKLTPLQRQSYNFFRKINFDNKAPMIVRFSDFARDTIKDLAATVRASMGAVRMETPQERRQHRVTTIDAKQPTTRCGVCGSTGHRPTECFKWTKGEVQDRWEIAKKERLCFRCLRFRGKKHMCRPKECGVNGCKQYHHATLHKDRTPIPADDRAPAEAINSAWTSAAARRSYLKIIPVQVSGPAGVVNTFALLDDGSTVTLIDNEIAEQVGAKGPIDPLHIEAINEMKTTEHRSRRVTVVLRGSNDRRQKVTARTVKDLRVAAQEVSRKHIEACKHLNDISDILSYDRVKPRILIGQDNWHLLLCTAFRRGNKQQPVASLTPLGWVLHGSQTRTLGRSVDYVSHVVTADEDMEKLMKNYFEMDALCITPKKPQSDPEEQALRILEKATVQKENNRYETSLLWRKEDVTLPDNYANSLRRLHGIEKKLDRDPQLKERYTEQMEALVKKGYAERAPTDTTEGKTWYLPHFAVINPMKPDKLRVVHDAAAKTKGVSLNDVLLKGPDLLQSLPGVIMRFRQHQTAVTADIAEMFMQVKLRIEDRDALRYLWRGDRRDDQPPEEYRMTSLIFGASSSPSTAIYVKNVNAKKHEQLHPEAAAAIERKHYVDDYLDSFKSTDDAIRIASAVREVHRGACFELKQWKSNSPQLLEALGENREAEDTELYKEEAAERVLGLIWRPTADELTFNLNMSRIPTQLIEGKTPTKREALRIVMSLFDPLGFAAPVTIRAKQILQEVWRRGTNWDEELEDDLAEQWRRWTEHLRHLNEVTIPRRYLEFTNSASLQLHIFTDASESSYSAVLYWRTVTSSGEVKLSLIIAKAKVSPLKLTSIPRLELQAAVMGARLAEIVVEEHERKPDSKVFWTDSKTALTWIRTGSRSYKPYVAHRLAAIEECSAVKEWRWVPTKHNVADDATRDVPPDFNKQHRWYTGPAFLYENEDAWPTEVVATAPAEPTGEERVNHIAVKQTTKLSEGLPDATRFSNWDRLRYATARVLQFINLCRSSREKVHYKRTRKNKEADPAWKKTTAKQTAHRVQLREKKEDRKYIPVTAELLREAEELLMKASQIDSFFSDIQNLTLHQPASRDGRLQHLSVELREGALRLRGRINAAAHVPENVRQPMVLDGDHPTVGLWVLHVHRRLHHAGVEATVNECRQHYWVLRLRPTTRALLRRCLHCRLRTRVPPHPRTGDLPACRLAHHQRAFTYTGVDYFGPLTVTVGRAHQKRYVAIFTCLTTRAIHLEVAGSLSTDSAIMALRRMIARRGYPTQIWSDNGTNLRGADRELRSAINAATEEEAAKKTISWRYIPPGAPFMGGAWERMVRSVKTALTATLHERCPTEEVLTTLLAEVEFSVNSRPLTHVSVSPDDPEALTPNHFLLGDPGRAPTPGEFNERDEVSRSSWRAAQRLTDIFWQRWLREYLPELQHRREPHGRGHNVEVDDLVQLMDYNVPRNVWLRGRVVATYPGPDGVVRAVDILTKGGVLRRPVRKLVVLPTEVIAPDQRECDKSHGGSNVRDNVG